MKYLDNGFGLPITLQDIQITNVQGIDTPLVNWNQVSDALLQILANQPTELNGQGLKFIRHKLKLTYKEFADLFNVSMRDIKDMEANNKLVTITKEVQNYVREKINDI